MKKLIYIIYLIFVLCSCSPKDKISKACFEQKCFEVEIADTKQEKERGLMNRETLEIEKGMLFIYKTEDIYSFWMKNTKIPLDIIWINENFKVVSIFPNAQPCETEECESIRPLKKAKYVLEINGGLATEKGIELHDFVQFK